MDRENRSSGRRSRDDRSQRRQSSRRSDARSSQPSSYARGGDSFAEIEDFGEFGEVEEYQPQRRQQQPERERRTDSRPRRQRELRERPSRDAKRQRAAAAASGAKGLVGRIAETFAGDMREAMSPVEENTEVLYTRERFLAGAFGALAAVVGLRLLQVQVFQHRKYAEAAAYKRTANGIVIPASRGTIYDRNGNVLASSVSTRQVILNPSNVTGNHKEIARRLVEAIGGDAAEYERALSNKSSQYYLAARQVDIDVAESLTDIAGIELVKDSRRMYPYDEVAGQVVGVSDVDGNGLTGLELYYEDVLKGTDGSITIQRGLHGEPIPGGVEREEPAVDGDDIVVSLDLELQQYAEAKLAAAVEEWKADSGNFVIMDASNGEIYAIGSTPFLNAANFAHADADAFQLKAVNTVFEPGSTFKCVTAAALLNENAVTADAEIDVDAILEFEDWKIGDSHAHGDIVMSFRDVIAESSNIGTVNASKLIGSETLYSYIERLGFTSKSGIDYPGDSAGLLLPLEEWTGATEMNVPFGQGISCTSVQLVRGIAPIHNRGVMVTPHLLIDKPLDANFKREWPTEEVLSEQACIDLNDILESVVEYGTGTNAAIDGYTVAGKTGTAQKIDSETGKYSDVEYVTSFIGWLPNTDCSLVCLVSLDNPKTGAGGGLVAGPVFADIMSFACDRYKVNPDVSSTVSGVANANEGAGA